MWGALMSEDAWREGKGTDGLTHTLLANTRLSPHGWQLYTSHIAQEITTHPRVPRVTSMIMVATGVQNL